MRVSQARRRRAARRSEFERSDRTVSPTHILRPTGRPHPLRYGTYAIAQVLENARCRRAIVGPILSAFAGSALGDGARRAVVGVRRNRSPRAIGRAGASVRPGRRSVRLR